MKKHNDGIQKASRNKGITLVALVITIIIIIILATVAISFAFGQNGLINRAEDATKYYANDAAYTEGSITNVEAYINSVLVGTEGGEKDTIPPTVGVIEVGTISTTTIEVKVNATDESGVELYKYFLNGEEIISIENNSYTFTGLTPGTNYTIKVEAYDKAGNKGESQELMITTVPDI